MATFYLDMYGGGNDANDGTTPSTPKATLNAATALVTAVTDEIRVRGVDSLFTSVGNVTWTKDSSILTATGDLTAIVTSGKYICKTIIASGTTMPELFIVSTCTYNAGTNKTTIQLLMQSTCRYYGKSETIDSSILIVTQTIALQDFGRDGKTSGTAASFTRVDTQITGGWNSGYTAQNSFTFCNSATASNYSVLNHNITKRQYWHLKRFIIINTNQLYTIRSTYCSFTDSVLLGVSNKNCIFSSVLVWMIFNNCYLHTYNTNYGVFYDNTDDAFYFNNSILHNSAYSTTILGDGHSFNNTIISHGAVLFNNLYSSTFNNCTLINRNRIAGTSSNNTFNNCKIIAGNSNEDFGASTFSGGTYTGGVNFTNVGNITKLSATTTTSIFTNTGNFIDNYLSGTSITFSSNKTILPYIINGNIGVNVKVKNAYGIFYNNTGFALETNAQLYGGTMIYDSNNTMVKTNFARIADNLSAPYIYQPQNTAWLQTPSGNTIFYNGGFVDLTSDVYTGKTTGSTSGMTALRLYNGLNHATDSVFRTVDFNVTSGATGTIKFWAKGSTTFTLEYNFMNSANELIWSAWKTASLTTSYQEFSQAIAAGDINYDGTMTLWFRIPSQAAGTYALIDYIQLT